MQGRVFDIKQFAIHDGEGIRTTVFLKGCPLDCWWCHNPESKTAAPQLAYSPTQCADTGECVPACPEGAITRKDGGGIAVDRAACEHCFECVDACPSAALERVGRDVTVDDVLAEVRKSVPFFDASEGGLTVSGGEPLAQPDFLAALLERAQAEGIPTTLDTTGYAPDSVVRSVAPHVDTFLYDVKFVDDDRHREYTGVSNEPILDTLDALAERGRGEDVVVRRPVLTDLNDGPGHTEALVDLLAGYESIDRVDLLPYHDVSEKFDRFDHPDRLESRDRPADATLERIAATLEAAGLSVTVSGY